MDKALYRIQTDHLRRCLEALRLLDLAELATCAETHGTQADKALISAVRQVLDTLPNDSH
jgi:hypothetical protein